MPNTFHPSFGSRPDEIVGRDKVIEQFLKGLDREPGHRDRATLILGQRGMGKTALLLQFAEIAKEKGYIAARVTSSENMLDEIIESIQIAGSDYVANQKTHIKGFSVGALGFSFGLTFSEEVQKNYGFRTKLSLLCDRLAESDHKILLLIDEVQPDTDSMRTLASTYQHLAGEEKDIAIVMAGLPGSISRVLNDKVLTFLNRARKQHLGPLSIGAVTSYYSSAFAREHRSITPNQISRAANATRGFPYLLQLIGYYVLELTHSENDLTDDVLENAINAAQEELKEDVFSPTLNVLSRKDIEILTAIAQQGAVASVAEVISALGITNNYFQQYRARLIDAGVVEAPRDGELSITVPYLDEYLRSTQS